LKLNPDKTFTITDVQQEWSEMNQVNANGEWFLPVKGHEICYKGTYEFKMKNAQVVFDLSQEAMSKKQKVWHVPLQGTNKILDRGYQVSLSNKLSEITLTFTEKDSVTCADYEAYERPTVQKAVKMNEVIETTLKAGMIDIKPV